MKKIQKTKIIYKKRPKTLAELKKDLALVLHRFVRRRDSQDEYFDCISCGRHLFIDVMNAGHFLPSTYAATRFDERNVHGQCQSCNLFKRGNLIEYRPRLIQKIGKEAVEELESKRHDLFKQPREWYESKIAEYKAKVSEYNA